MKIRTHRLRPVFHLQPRPHGKVSWNAILLPFCRFDQNCKITEIEHVLTFNIRPISQHGSLKHCSCGLHREIHSQHVLPCLLLWFQAQVVWRLGSRWHLQALHWAPELHFISSRTCQTWSYSPLQSTCFCKIFPRAGLSGLCWSLTLAHATHFWAYSHCTPSLLVC